MCLQGSCEILHGISQVRILEYSFSSSHVWIQELEHKVDLVLKNRCFQSGAGEDFLRAPWTARRSNHSILKEIKPEYSLEGLMLKLEHQHFGHLMQRAGSLEKNPDARKHWGQGGKGVTEDEIVGCHHQLKGHEFEQTQGDSEGQGNLVCSSLWDCRESDATYQLKNNNTGVGCHFLLQRLFLTQG